MRLAVIGLVSLLLVLGPDAMLNRRVAERQWQIRTKLPDMLDLLMISVEAGLGFEQALDRTTSRGAGPARPRSSPACSARSAPAPRRAESLRALERRCDVPEMRSFVLAILQADTFGVSIGRVLRTQADEMRIKRRQLAQEQAQKAPVKMLIPMVLCIFPVAVHRGARSRGHQHRPLVLRPAPPVATDLEPAAPAISSEPRDSASAVAADARDVHLAVRPRLGPLRSG